MNSTDLAFTPALEQAKLIRDKVISPLELTQLYLDRIEQLDGSLNSFFTVMAEQATADAKAKTELLATQTAESASLPLFFGVPIGIKDFSPVAGAPCTYGIHLLKNKVATEDAGVVTRFRQAGFTILGKTATSEIGTSPYPESRGFPPTHNPWNWPMHPTIRVGEWAKLRAAKELEHIINWIAPCPPFNVTGQPAISVPVGFTPDSLPLGVQLVGRPGEETTILALAAQIEAAKPWRHHRPRFAC